MKGLNRFFNMLELQTVVSVLNENPVIRGSLNPRHQNITLNFSSEPFKSSLTGLYTPIPHIQ
jgi:hypothetical protein